MCENKNTLIQSQESNCEIQTSDDLNKFEYATDINLEKLHENTIKADKIDLVLEKIDDLKNDFTKIETEFESKLKYDQHKDKIIDNLHSELQNYKNALLKKIIQPVLSDIIMLIDDVRKLYDNYKDKPLEELDPSKLLKQMKSFPSDLEDILYRQGIEPFVRNEDYFNPSFQQAIKTLETNDKEKDKKIAGSIRNGYMWDEKVFRPEKVEVYVYKTKDSSNQNESEQKNEVENNE